MREWVVKVGRVGVTIAITLASLVVSLLVTIVLMEFFGPGVAQIDIVIALVAPFFIAPVVSWYMLGLFYRLHTLEEEQRYLATYDGLTGLMTRGALFACYEKVIANCQLHAGLVTVAIIDIDDFKSINDQYGHAGGDAVLRSFAKVAEHYVTEHNFVGRIGGEEFVFVLSGLTITEAEKVLNQLLAGCVADQVTYADQAISYTVSMGVSRFDIDAPVSAEQLLRQADEALYKAKKTGKNCLVNYQ